MPDKQVYAIVSYRKKDKNLLIGGGGGGGGTVSFGEQSYYIRVAQRILFFGQDSVEQKDVLRWKMGFASLDFFVLLGDPEKSIPV